MSHCRACNAEIEVKWIVPLGTNTPILESLCSFCLKWVEVAKSKEPLKPPTARRRPIRRPQDTDSVLDYLDEKDI